MEIKPFENKEVFEATFKEFYTPLVNFINKYLNDFEASQEVVQNTFVKIWQNKHKIEITTSIKSYIYKMCKNSMIDYIRKNKNHIKVDVDNSVLENIEDESHTQLDPYIIRQSIEIVLKDFRERSREIFLLNKFEGLNYSEIAEHLNISKRSVEDNISKVMKELKVKLQNAEYLLD